jgi:hypothetical protein
MTGVLCGRHWIDPLVIVVLAVAAYAIDVQYVRQTVAAGLGPKFYQSEFGPAVMLTCGYGYVSPDVDEIPVLNQFLNVERDSIHCHDLPPAAKLKPLTGMQSAWKFQLWTAAAIWSVVGISWRALVGLSGAYFAATVILAYGLTRTLAGRVASTLVAIGVLLSPLHWSQTPHIRDYSKAPFMLGAFILLALLVRTPLLPRRLLLVAGGFGLLLGIGFGFRSDLLIVVPAFVISVVAFLPGGVLRNVTLKAQALAVTALAFCAVAWPLFGSPAMGGGLSIIALHGFVSPFDRALEVDSGPYEFGYVYNDLYMAAVMRDFARRQQRVEGPISLYQSQFNRAGDGVVRELFAIFPADILARAYASVLSIIRLPASNWTDSHWPPGLPPDGVWQRVFAARARLLEKIRWLWPAAVILSLVAASFAEIRLAAFAAFFMLYFTGSAAIQFQERHFFHLDVVPMLAVAAVAAQLRWAVGQGANWARVMLSSGALLRGSAFCVALLVCLVTPLVAARAYQASYVRATLADRLAAPREVIPLTEQPIREAGVIFDTGVLPADEFAQSRVGTVTSEYLRVRLGGDRCEALKLPITLRYRAPFPTGDFSRTMSIRMPTRSSALVQVLAPVFYRYPLPFDEIDVTERLAIYQFRGLETAAADATCVQGIDRIIDTGRYPLLLSAALAPGWQEARLYQTIAAIERRSPRSDAIATFTAPGDLPVSKKLLSLPLKPLTVAARANALTATTGGWRMDGEGGIRGVGPFAYLLETAAKSVRAGDQLIVDGVMRNGGLSVGLVRDDKWLIQTPVVGEGRFLAVVQVPSDGTANVVIANNLAEGSSSNHFEIMRAGWKEAAPAW